MLNQTPRAGVKIYYDRDCGFCLRAVGLIKKLFLLPQIEIAGAQSEAAIEAAMRQRNSWVVLDADGARHFGYDAVLVVAALSPVFRFFTPLLNLDISRRWGERIYRYVATHRRTRCALPANSSIKAKLPR
jgi:predicted DCC family thiol-disulfide oxidoreductase YuxK